MAQTSKIVNVRVDGELWSAAKTQAALQDRTMTSWLARAIRAALGQPQDGRTQAEVEQRTTLLPKPMDFNPPKLALDGLYEEGDDLTPHQIRILRATCIGWIESPFWDGYEHLYSGLSPQRQQLRAEAGALQTVAELEDWCAKTCSFQDMVFWHIDNDVTAERKGAT